MDKSQGIKIGIRVFGIAFLVFVFGTVMFAYMSSHSQTVINRERQSFDMVEKRLELNLNTRLMAMQFLASDPEIKGMQPEEVHRELVRPVEILKFFNVGVVDRQGALISEVRPTCISRVVYDVDSFNKVLSGELAITDVSVCKAHPNVSLRVPIYGENGEVKAVLVGVMLLQEIAKLVEVDSLGTNRYIFIKDGNNNKIYYPEGKSDEQFSRDMQMEFNGKSNGLVKDDSQGYANSNLYLYNTVENSNWHIVMVVPMKEVYRLALQRSFNFFMVSCLLIVCAMLLYRNYRQQQCYNEDRQRLRMERLLSVNQLAAGLAHEIRNPLTSIKGFIQLMVRRADKIPNQNHMEIILTEIDRIDKLVGEFQLLTRPLKTPHYVEINVERMVNDVMILMESQAVDKNVELEFVNKIGMLLPNYTETMDGILQPKKMHILGEETQLKQVFINLIKNAIEVVGENGKVDVTLTIGEKMAVVTVADNGCGMSDDVLKRIGTPFFTTKASGNGLGLSVCYNIIHSHGGRIVVQSEVGKGTSFAVMLPYVAMDR